MSSAATPENGLVEEDPSTRDRSTPHSARDRGLAEERERPGAETRHTDDPVYGEVSAAELADARARAAALRGDRRLTWWQHPWVFLTLVFIGCKLLWTLIGLFIIPNFYVAGTAMVPGPHTFWGPPQFEPCPGVGKCAQPDTYGPFSMWFRFDSMHYITQVEVPLLEPAMPADQAFLEQEPGYGRPLNPSLDRFAWAPLFMILGKVLMPLTGSAAVSLFIVANIGFFCCLYFAYRLGERIFDSARAGRMMVTLLVLLPGGFILQAVLSEPLFVAASLATFYYAIQKRWWLAGVAALLLALSRSTGMAISAPLALLLLQQNGWVFWRAEPWRNVLKALPALLGGPLGWGLVTLWSWSIEGYWDVYNRVQANSWGVAMGDPFTQISGYFTLGPAETTRAMLLIVMLVCVLVAAVRMPLAYVLWGVLLLVIPLSLSGIWVSGSLMRYSATVFPLSLAGVYLLRRFPALTTPVVVLASCVQTGLFLLWQLDWTWSIV